MNRFLPDMIADRDYPVLPRHERERRPHWSRPKWRAMAANVRARDGRRCRHCGQRGGYLVVDHIWPLARGGVNTLENFQLLCDPCNGRKGYRMEAA